jgi:hypothetical protein
VLYPDEQLEEMLYTLRERGFLHFIRTYVRPDVSVRAIQLLLVRLGSLLVGTSSLPQDQDADAVHRCSRATSAKTPSGH